MSGQVAKAESIEVDAVFAESARAVVRTYRVASGTTVADLVRLAAADPAFAGLDVSAMPMGVFGMRTTPDSTLNEGDRVEFYRPLPNDPKQARRARVHNARRRS